MPGAPDGLIDTLEENIFMMDQLTTVLDEDGPEELFEQVLKGLEHHIVGESEVGYRCYCSRERVEEALRSIDGAELEAMINDGEDIGVDCQFCDEHYVFASDDLRRILEAKGEK